LIYSGLPKPVLEMLLRWHGDERRNFWFLHRKIYKNPQPKKWR
jgi:hypothetical protein